MTATKPQRTGRLESSRPAAAQRLRRAVTAIPGVLLSRRGRGGDLTVWHTRSVNGRPPVVARIWLNRVRAAVRVSKPCADSFWHYDTSHASEDRDLGEGLRDSGIAVAECNAPLGLDTAGRVAMLAQPWRSPALVARLAWRWATLSR